MTESGEPFFWLGDTAWELFHRLNREDAERYLENRAKKGFTVIQAVVLAEMAGLDATNPYGQLPLAERRRPHEARTRSISSTWIGSSREANSLGLYIGMLPTWGDKWNKKWGAGPEIFTPENAAALTASGWAGDTRMRALVWILGGDRPVDNDRQKEILRAMARGLRKGDGGAHLITFHPHGRHRFGAVVPRRRSGWTSTCARTVTRPSSPATTTRRAWITTARPPSR